MRMYGVVFMAVLMVAGPTVAGAFNQADLTRLNAGENMMQNADLSGVGNELTRKDLKHVDFSGADFKNSRLWGFVFDSAKLPGAKLDSASLNGSHFRSVNFKEASLRNSDMPHAQCGGADFSNADLSGAKANNAGFHSSKLIKAKLAGADLRDAMLFNADLTGADLTNATLTNADFDSVKVDASWKTYIQSQNVRNFDKIVWGQRQAVKPSPEMVKPGAGKADKEMVAPKVPIKK